MPKNYRLSLDIIVYRSGPHWIAHCLQTDIVSEGDSAGDAIASVLRLMAFQLETASEDEDINSIFRPAPAEYWSLFARGADIAIEQRPFLECVSSIEAREVVLA
jgi:hypothetical protein